MKKIIEKLLTEGKAKKHYTYNDTGIVGICLKKIRGTAGTDVDHAYVYPDGKIDVCYNNTHYGYAHFDERLNVVDNSNRSIFEIVDYID